MGRELAHRMHEAFNAFDLDAVDEIFAVDFFSHPLGASGPEAVKAAWRTVRERHPELRTVVEDVVVEGDRVAVRSSLRGASGAIMEIFRVADGRIAELWGVSSLPGGGTSTPREVVDELLRRTAAGPGEDMADLFAEDAVFELPYLPPGTPQPAPGREIFRGILRSAVGVQEFDAVDDVHHYEATDPEVVVTEYLLHGHVVATGKRFTSRVVMVNRVRHGLIVWSRSYSNPLDSAIAFDMVDKLLGGLSTS